MPEGHTIHRIARDHSPILTGLPVAVSSPQGRFEADAALVDGVVLDTAVGGRSGGTEVAFDWAASVPAVAALRDRTMVMLAGGLRPENVREAVRTLAPAAVDVSSGVEVSPGIKDHGLMRAFAQATRLHEI